MSSLSAWRVPTEQTGFGGGWKGGQGGIWGAGVGAGRGMGAVSAGVGGACFMRQGEAARGRHSQYAMIPHMAANLGGAVV